MGCKNKLIYVIIMNPGKSPQQQNLEGMNVTPEHVLRFFEESRIKAEEGVFASIYSTFDDDQERVKNLRHQFDQEIDKDKDGALGEALVFMRIQQGALSSQITTRATNLYDDFFHGADLVIESKARQLRDPIVSSVDVTIKAIGDQKALGFPFKEVSFDKKVERVKHHIDAVAKLSQRDAIEISAWLQSGGLSQPRTRKNEAMFDAAERLMLLKYYKNPPTSEDPERPHFVVAGPQVVVSIDRSFVNKVFHGDNQEKALKNIDLLLQAQVPFSILILKHYIESLKKRGQGNVFLDANLVACRAWELTFNNEVYQARLTKALQECSRDPQLREQLAYYQQIVSRILKG